MDKTQICGCGSRIILLMCMSLSACTAGNGTNVVSGTAVVSNTTNEHDSESITAASEITDTHTESTSADTQTGTWLTVEDFPALVPDVLKLREKEYEDMPYLETQEQLSEYALWNFLCGRTEFECRLSRNLSYNVSAVALDRACEAAMSYYLFSSYNVWDMITEDDGNPDSIYGKVKLVYDMPAYDLEARVAAWSYIVNNPPPKDGFTDYDEEREYARNIHDYVACRVTYDPMGYDPKNMTGRTRYENLQEAYNVLGENQKTAVCAGYARAFALICQYAGINCAWVRGNETEESSHAWNVIYPCDGSEPVLVDVTWDDGLSLDTVGQTDVEDTYFYIPLSVEYEHEADENMADFIQYINAAASG